MSYSLFYFFYLLFVAQKGAKRPGTRDVRVAHSSARELLRNITRSVKSCRSLLVAIAWGGATRCAQTYPRLFLCIARHLSLPLTVPVGFLELLLLVRTAQRGTFVSCRTEGGHLMCACRDFSTACSKRQNKVLLSVSFTAMVAHGKTLPLFKEGVPEGGGSSACAVRVANK